MEQGLLIEDARLRHLESGQRLSSRLMPAVRLVVVALAIAFVIRIFLVQPFAVPSGSMAPTLKAGDFVLVNKQVYGWTAAALPLAQPFSEGGLANATRIGGGAIQPGEVIVFVGADGKDFVKRMVAGPGDRVEMQAGELILNGLTVRCEPTGDRAGNGAGDRGNKTGGYCRERLPNGSSHLIHTSPDGPLANFGEITVPAGHYFVLGDNRDVSADSRLPRSEGGVGLVADGQVIGRASRIFFSLTDRVRWKRIGQPID